MKHIARSAIALITAVGLAFTVVPAAQASTPYVAATSCTLFGEGTAEQPYRVESVNDLLQYRACLSGNNLTIHFSQRANVYLDDTRPYPTPSYSGSNSVVYDANGYGIFGLYVNASAASGANEAALFGSFTTFGQGGFTLRDLHLSARDIVAVNNPGSRAFSAGFFSSIQGSEMLFERVSIVADRIAVTTASSQQETIAAASLIAYATDSNITVRDTSVRVSQLSADNSRGVGGLFGSTENYDSTARTVVVTGSRVQSAVSGTGGSGSIIRVGGLLGHMKDYEVTISRTLFDGSVNGSGGTVGAGGAIGSVQTTDSATTSIDLNDVVVLGTLGSGTTAGFVGYVNLSSGPKVPIRVSNSIFAGELAINSQPFSSLSTGVVGPSSDRYDLTMNRVLVDAEFKKTSGSSVTGALFSPAPPVGLQAGSRTVTTGFFNSTKVAAAQWDSLDDHQAESHWGATPLTQAEFGQQGSFAGLTFGAPNGAPTPGVFEMCAGGTRPHHSIEASACNAPALNLPSELNLVVGEQPNVAATNDPTQFKLFTITPPLPQGLELNPFTGRLFGAPLVASLQQNYTVTGVSNGGNLQQSFDLSVAASSIQLTLDPNDSSGQTEHLSVASGIVTMPANPFGEVERSFLGWNLGSPNGEFFEIGSTLTLGANTNLYANWLDFPDCTDDGSAFGGLTVLCDDSRPAAGIEGYSRYYGSVADGDLLYFGAESALWGAEIWQTNGTPEGTRMIADLFPGLDDSLEGLLGKLGDRLLFFDFNNEALMAYDLETKVKIALTPNDTLESYEGEFQAAVLGDKLIFNGRQAATGHELWVSDGTPGGTSILKDTNPGIGDSYPIGLLEHEGYVYFGAADDGSNFELWRTDGTADGTQLFLDLAPGTSSNPYPHAVVGGRLIVTAFGVSSDRSANGIYAVDLDLATATRLTTDYPGYFSGVLGDGSGLIFSSGGLFTGNEVWFTDGTPSGTRKLTEIRAAGSSANFDGFFSAGGDVFFTADDGTGQSVYRTDGTANGTVKTFTNLTDPELVGVVNGKVIISADGSSGNDRLYAYSDPAYVAPPTVTQNPGTQPPAGATGGAPATPQVTSAPAAVSAPGQSFELRGANLRGVLVTIDGKSAFSKINEAGNLEVIVPNLSPGTYDIVLTLGSATITMSSHLILGSTANAALGEPRGWTKRISETEIKLYFKNPVGAGKVQLYHNGQEIAWVNARTSADPKLREAGGSQYLVRTRRLEPGFNTFEIYVDGVRVERRVQSN